MNDNPLNVERPYQGHVPTLGYDPNSCQSSLHTRKSTYYSSPSLAPNIHGPLCSGTMCGGSSTVFMVPRDINLYYPFLGHPLAPLVKPPIVDPPFPHGKLYDKKNPSQTIPNNQHRQPKMTNKGRTKGTSNAREVGFQPLTPAITLELTQ